MVEVFKILEGLVDLDINDFFEVVADHSTTGHNHKLKVN